MALSFWSHRWNPTFGVHLPTMTMDRVDFVGWLGGDFFCTVENAAEVGIAVGTQVSGNWILNRSKFAQRLCLLAFCWTWCYIVAGLNEAFCRNRVAGLKSFFKRPTPADCCDAVVSARRAHVHPVPQAGRSTNNTTAWCHWHKRGAGNWSRTNAQLGWPFSHSKSAMNMIIWDVTCLRWASKWKRENKRNKPTGTGFLGQCTDSNFLQFWAEAQIRAQQGPLAEFFQFFLFATCQEVQSFQWLTLSLQLPSLWLLNGGHWLDKGRDRRLLVELDLGPDWSERSKSSSKAEGLLMHVQLGAERTFDWWAEDTCGAAKIGTLMWREKL